MPLLRRFVALGTSNGGSSGYLVKRIKQWLRLANHDGRLGWFEEVKRCEGLQDLLDHLAALDGSPQKHAPGVLLVGGPSQSQVFATRKPAVM